MNELFDSIQGFVSGVDDLVVVKKHLDKAMVRLFLAPAKRSQADRLISTKTAEMKDSALVTKTGIEAVARQMDIAIKGQWAQAIEEAVASKVKGYDNF